MKIVKKTDLTFVDGYLVDANNEIVCINKYIVNFFNDLEDKVQKAAYLAEQPDFVGHPSLNGFVRKNVWDSKLPVITRPKCPVSEKKQRESLAWMEEQEKIEDYKNMKEFVIDNPQIFEWIANDTVVCLNNEGPIRFNTPVIGNPLLLTTEQVINYLATDVKE